MSKIKRLRNGHTRWLVCYHDIEEPIGADRLQGQFMMIHRVRINKVWGKSVTYDVGTVPLVCSVAWMLANTVTTFNRAKAVAYQYVEGQVPAEAAVTLDDLRTYGETSEFPLAVDYLGMEAFASDMVTMHVTFDQDLYDSTKGSNGRAN